MSPVRMVIAIVAALSASEAVAQTPWPAAPAPGSSGMVTSPGMGAPSPMSPAGPGGMPQQQQQQQPPCMNEFLPLRQDAEKFANVIRAASEKKIKLTPPEACNAFKNLTVAEAKVVKFIATNYAKCGIPAEAVTQVKANHDRTSRMRDNVCSAASRAGPAAPSLSDALGTTRVPNASSTSTGRGTLDTLTGGNPLAR